MTIFYLIYFYLIIQIITADISVYDNASQLLATIEDKDPSVEPTFPNEGLQGYLIVANPSDGCQPMSQPPSIAIPGYRWIALIRRSTDPNASCSFLTKINNAYQANFSAVIIYNYEDILVPMQLSDDDVNIPSTFVTHTDGLLLMKNYSFNASSAKNVSQIHLNILPNSPVSLAVYIIPFIIIIAITFCCLLGFVLFRWCLERRRSRRHRLPRSALRQLQTKKYVKTDPWEVCAICLDDYEEGAKLRILPCQHAYHMKCIDPWLINNRRQCPCCKRYVFPNHENSDGENDDHQPTPTERTPLITSNEQTPTTVLVRNRQGTEQQTGADALMESSDEEKEDFLLSEPRRTTTTTTAELIFERSSTNARQYGSLNGSSNTARGENFFVGSIGATTDNASVSGRSNGEDSVDTPTTNENHFEENQAFVNDEHSINSNQIHL